MIFTRARNKATTTVNIKDGFDVTEIYQNSSSQLSPRLMAQNKETPIPIVVKQIEIQALSVMPRNGLGKFPLYPKHLPQMQKHSPPVKMRMQLYRGIQSVGLHREHPNRS
jgi:hypothetical protein